MNDEKDEFVNTEEPIEVSDEERTLVLEALERVERGEVISHEEMKEHIQHLIDEYDSLPSYKENIVIKDKKQERIGTVSEL